MDELEQVPDIVYHYTSIDTMMKIVESESIWATSVCYLNDTSEQSHFLELVQSRIPHIKFATTEEHEAAETFQNVYEGGFESRPFIASFSEADSLPQSALSYCNAGNGVAIGFSTDCLSRTKVKTKATKKYPRTTLKTKAAKKYPPSCRFDRNNIKYHDAKNRDLEAHGRLTQRFLRCSITPNRLWQ